MRVPLKQLLRKSKSALIAYKILDNWRLKRRIHSGQPESLHGSTHTLILRSVDESIAYVNRQFADYLTYSGLAPHQFTDKRILELGYGDNVGVALRFLAAGADAVVCLDKFSSRRDIDRERQIYRHLRETLSNEERARFDQVVGLEKGIEINPHRLKRISGLTLETAVESLRELKKPFDFIVSRAVIEEVYEPDVLFRAADKVLGSGGYMLHKIDLSDYGIFSGAGMHPLTFLTIPTFVYGLMASDSGIPNRRLMGYYRDKMKALGYDARVFIASVIGSGTVDPHQETVTFGKDYSQATLDLINEIRPKLSEDFHRTPDDELMVSGIFLVARKPVRPLEENRRACQ